MVKVYGPGMPPRSPAAEARKAHQAARQQQLRSLLHQHVEATAVGLLELARIIGAVLLVLQLHQLTPAPMWLALVLCFAPNLASLGALAWALLRSRYVRWRVDREVR